MKWMNKWSMVLTTILLTAAGVFIVVGLYLRMKGLSVLEDCFIPAANLDKYLSAVHMVEQGTKLIYVGFGLGGLAQPETHILLYALTKGEKELPMKVFLPGVLFLFFGLYFILKGLI